MTPVVLGVAVLAAAGAGAARAAGVDWFTPARIAAVALAVVGIGLVYGATRRRGLGLLVVAVPLAGFVTLASLTGPIRFDDSFSGTHTWRPTTVDQLRPRYRVQFGESTLDLRGLDLTKDRTVRLKVTAGQLQVLVPPSIAVETSCHALAAQCPPEGRVAGDKPTDSTVRLDVDVRAGEVQVHHE